MQAQMPSVAQRRESLVATNRLIRNTYVLLSITLFTSATLALVSVLLRVPFITYLVCSGGSVLLMLFVLPKTKDSAVGLLVVFLITGLMGFGLGPILTSYLSLPGGSQIVMTAFGGTASIFLGLSGYALITRHDFSFIGGFIFAGMIVMLCAIVANLFLNMPALSLAVSSGMIFLLSGKILWDTSKLVHDKGKGNYLLMTVGLYFSMFMIFIHLMAILGIMRHD